MSATDAVSTFERNTRRRCQGTYVHDNRYGLLSVGLMPEDPSTYARWIAQYTVGFGPVFVRRNSCTCVHDTGFLASQLGFFESLRTIAIGDAILPLDEHTLLEQCTVHGRRR